MTALRTYTFTNPAGDVLPLAMAWGVDGLAGHALDLVLEPLPSVDGAVILSDRPEPLEVYGEIVVTASGVSAYQTALQSLVSQLYGPGTLKVVNRNGTERRLSDVYVAEIAYREAEVDHGILRVTFQSLSPWWEDFAATDRTFTLPPAAGDVSLAVEFPLIVAVSSVFSSVSVTNDGDALIWPVWELEGPADSGWSFDNLTTGSTLTVATALTAGQVATIDTRPGAKTILREDGTTNLIPTLTGRLWEIVKGSNSITVDVGGATAATEVRLSYRRRFRSA